MRRRDFLQGLAASSLILWLPESLQAETVLKPGNDVSFRCLGNVNGPRYLDGHTADGSVGLAPELGKKFSGTRWHVFYGGVGAIALQCKGTRPGSRWLDGRTANGTVGLAPTNQMPYTGTRWQIVLFDNNPSIVGLKCMGNIQGPRWLDGRTGNGTVGLAKTTDPPFTGTRWEVKAYPVCIDSPC
jgi:hypothetical protein